MPQSQPSADKPTNKPAINRARSVFLVGLGRFGGALAAELMELDVEVMAVDIDSNLVNTWADRLTHVRLADATSTTALRQLGAPSFDAAVVAIGSDIEASILTTAALVDIEGPTIWAKALTEEHGRILERIGAHHIVFPERQMGQRVAHVVSGRVVDYYELDDGFALAELPIPKSIVGRTLGDSNIRANYGVTVVCIKPANGRFTYATPETLLSEGDLILVAGEVEACETFAATAQISR